jgi:hypothetical protein
MPQIATVDVEGAVRSYVMAYPGLTGAGNPLAGGVHLQRRRSPSRGAVADMQVVPPVTLDDTTHTARVTFAVRAVGSEDGARYQALTACRRLAEAVLALSGRAVVVTTGMGEQVRLIVAGESAGPTFGGDQGGECTYLFDATFRCQPVG